MLPQPNGATLPKKHFPHRVGGATPDLQNILQYPISPIRIEIATQQSTHGSLHLPPQPLKSNQITHVKGPTKFSDISDFISACSVNNTSKTHVVVQNRVKKHLGKNVGHRKSDLGPLELIPQLETADEFETRLALPNAHDDDEVIDAYCFGNQMTTNPSVTIPDEHHFPLLTQPENYSGTQKLQLEALLEENVQIYADMMCDSSALVTVPSSDSSESARPSVSNSAHSQSEELSQAQLACRAASTSHSSSKFIIPSVPSLPPVQDPTHTVLLWQQLVNSTDPATFNSFVPSTKCKSSADTNIQTANHHCNFHAECNCLDIVLFWWKD